MANEFHLDSVPGLVLYGTAESPSGMIWNGGYFEGLSTADWANYAVSVTDPSGVGRYRGNLPPGISAAGDYILTIYLQGGSAPASTDLAANTKWLSWGGSTQADQAILTEVLPPAGTPVLT